MLRQITATRLRQTGDFEIDSKLTARLGNVATGAQIEFGVTPGLVDAYMVVTMPDGEKVVETIHLPFFAAEWAAAIESEMTA